MFFWWCCKRGKWVFANQGFAIVTVRRNKIETTVLQKHEVHNMMSMDASRGATQDFHRNHATVLKAL